MSVKNLYITNVLNVIEGLLASILEQIEFSILVFVWIFISSFGLFLWTLSSSSWKGSFIYNSLVEEFPFDSYTAYFWAFAQKPIFFLYKPYTKFMLLFATAVEYGEIEFLNDPLEISALYLCRIFTKFSSIVPLNKVLTFQVYIFISFARLDSRVLIGSFLYIRFCNNWFW